MVLSHMYVVKCQFSAFFFKFIVSRSRAIVKRKIRCKLRIIHIFEQSEKFYQKVISALI